MRRLKIKTIHNDEMDWMEDQEDIEASTVEFFQQQFTKQKDAEDFFLLQEELPTLVRAEQHEKIRRI